MREIKCNFCGSHNYEERQIDYLYRHKGKYLLVPNTPVQICLDCGMIYYDAKILNKIEQYFFDIYQNHQQPDEYVSIPTKVF